MIRRYFTYLACLAWVLVIIPGQAYAQTGVGTTVVGGGGGGGLGGGILVPGCSAGGITLECCAPGFQPWDFTAKVVECIRKSIKQATTDVMQALSDFMKPVVGALATLAIAIFGMRILMGGGSNLLAQGGGFILRLCLVLMFSYNLGGFASAVFDIEDAMIGWVSPGPPWTVLDELLGRILGVGPDPNTNISKGLLGIIGVSLFSSTVGGVLFIAGLSALINMLMFVFRVVFTYLTAITLIGFLIVISPLVIPMALFVQHTERFFNKWLDILFSAMLVPVLLFAVLGIFLTVFSGLINEIFTLLCGTDCVTPGSGGTPSAFKPGGVDFSYAWKINQPKFGWLVPSDPGLTTRLQDATGITGVGNAAVQIASNPLARGSHDASPGGLPGISFGPNDVQVMQQLIYALLGLWIFASFMKSLVDQVPNIAYNITEAASYISMQPTNIEKNVQSGIKQLQTAVTGKK